MKSIIFIAPPAAGKGVQSGLLQDKYNMSHISTGDLLRDEVKACTELGKELDEIMKSGNLVSDDIITTLLEKRLKEINPENGYILDGYPRTLEQAKSYDEILNKLGMDLGVVIYLDIDEELALKRIVGRVSCPKCGASYNKYFDSLKPKTENVCDKCQEELVSRADDNEESFRHRFTTYLEKTAPLIQYYEDKGVLHRIAINENTEPNDVFEQIEGFIN